jgi:hypothetical protein
MISCICSHLSVNRAGRLGIFILPDFPDTLY